jgi:outer membrane protein, heavy metal efflux system
MRLLSGLVVVLGAAALYAEDSRLQLNDLIKEALTNNPEIQAAQKRYESVGQRASQAGALPDPMFSVGYNSVGNPLPGAGLGRDPVANIGAMVSQEFPGMGKRRARVDVSNKEAAVEYQNYVATQWSVISRLKQAYCRLQHSYEVIPVLERNRDLLNNLIKVTELRYSVGGAAQQDVFKTQTQISILEGRILQMMRDRHSAEAEVNMLIGRPANAAVSQPADLHEAARMPADLDALYTNAKANAPVLARGEKSIQRAEASVNLARRDYYPDYTLTGGYFSMGSMGSMYEVRADIRIPAFWQKKQRAEVTEQVQSLSQARRAYEADAQNLAFRIKDEYLTAETALKLADLYKKTVLPQAGLALDSSLASYETGKLDFQAVLTNYMTVLDNELNYHEQLQTFYLALARLEELTGMPLTGGQAQ